ncbi:gelsolin, cytoplasmic-like isoform X1 [Argiope bruennichi]|uniref:gelsolin, cytoplasmic-like isoform X1 n=1 Tax=Argiope bruennichi TaxID=94029 RepID=UPI002494D54E|nr:gelsolin, cytoplasmic-like isoform X1 [Argiope bruennichi]
MTVIDPAFEGVGQTPGLTIWRIEDFEVKSVPTSEYGNFYSGDSYIVLSTKETKSGKLEWNIHFWLGEETSQDESGTAAIKSVELDDVLGGSPVQHREVQNFESALFLSYFKKGIRYLKGGIKSGFHHVENVPVKRFLRVKGRRNVRLNEMPIEVSSMNIGDCFILDSEPNVFIYVGPQSGHMERIKAIQAANAIRDDLHGGRSEVKIIDENCSSSEIQEFFNELGGGSPNDVAEGTSDDDKKFEANFESKIALYKIWENESGELQHELVSEKPLKQEYLQSDDCFLLDGGINGLFVWIGKNSSREERIGAMKLANQKYIEMKGYPKWLQVKRVIQYAEPPLFKSYFSVWKEQDDEMTMGRYFALEQAMEDEDSKKKCALYAKSVGKATSFMPDDGSGEIEIWRVDNFDLVPVEESQKGIFFGGDSYIIKYTYHASGEQHILYFWQGQSSSQDERAASAMLTVKMDNELGGKAVQVRVVHGQEPEHFLRVFKGRMVILMGGHASGFKNIHDHDSFDMDGTLLFQVRGTNEFNTRAEQVPEKSDSLNSNDVFILETPSVTYLWIGQDSNEEEHNMGQNLTEIASPGREVIEIKEGDEPGEFWDALGGKTEYPKSKDLPSRPFLQPRLFRISDQTGKVKMEEICNFTQEDLAEDDVMILDCGDAIYVWVGQGANQEEREASLKMTEDYVHGDPTDRHPGNTVIITVKQGAEPAAFKLYFGEWNADLCQELSKLALKV